MQMRTNLFVGPPRAIATTLLLVLLVLSGCTAERHWGGSSRAGEGGKIKIGLVTKTESNPYFVKLRDAATAAADARGAELIALAGKFDGDNEGQVIAIENLVRQGVSGILITPSSTGGGLGAIKSDSQQDVVVIALDPATEPETVVDATFATNNKQAGVLLGQYIKARMGNTPPKILSMDLDPSASVGIARHNGFLEGMGLPLDTPAVIGTALTQGDQSKAQQAMENLLQRSAAQVNVVYNINEPAARGRLPGPRRRRPHIEGPGGSHRRQLLRNRGRQGGQVRGHRHAVPEEDGRGRGGGGSRRRPYRKEPQWIPRHGRDVNHRPSHPRHRFPRLHLGCGELLGLKLTAGTADWRPR